MNRYRIIETNGGSLIEDTQEDCAMRLTAVCERLNLLSDIASKRLGAILDRDHAIEDLRRTMELAVLGFGRLGTPEDVAVFQSCLDRTVVTS